ncbi:MAG TPA: hypothetical protein VHV83_11795 [Armatimonadota bacterium]|nr:hypothetical protein [Armatimonadota bacterium]
MKFRILWLTGLLMITSVLWAKSKQAPTIVEMKNVPENLVIEDTNPFFASFFSGQLEKTDFETADEYKTRMADYFSKTRYFNVGMYYTDFPYKYDLASETLIVWRGVYDSIASLSERPWKPAGLHLGFGNLTRKNAFPIELNRTCDVKKYTATNLLGGQVEVSESTYHTFDLCLRNAKDWREQNIFYTNGDCMGLVLLAKSPRDEAKAMVDRLQIVIGVKFYDKDRSFNGFAFATDDPTIHNPFQSIYYAHIIDSELQQVMLRDPLTNKILVAYELQQPTKKE